MFSNLTVGLLVGIGAAGWFYAKTMRQTGNNTKSALTVAAISGLITCIIITVIISLIFN